MARILTITTDFGRKDAYVASLKAAIVTIAPPDVRLIDVSHDVTPHDIMEAAFVLRAALPYFPAGTVHLAVVDPRVGSSRLAVAARKDDHWFVAPDNGLLPLVFDREPPDEIVALDKPHFWRTPDPCDTFHARDIFAPISAHIAAGRTLSEIGSPIEALKPMHWALPITDDQGIQGWVVHIDHFGNCITNITSEMLAERQNGRPTKCYVGNAIVEGVRHTYADVVSGDPLLLFGSNNCLEIAVNSGNASILLDISKGAPVNLVFVEDR